MPEILKLSKPVMINGSEVKELPYDFENMTAKDKLDAGKKMKVAQIPISNVEELDSDYHFFLFVQAVCKADSSIDINDVMRISAKDAREAGKLARSFFYFDSEESSQTIT